MKKADSWQQENGRENTLFLKALYHREKCKSKNLLNFLFFFQNIFPKILQKIYNKCRNGIIPYPYMKTITLPFMWRYALQKRKTALNPAYKNPQIRISILHLMEIYYGKNAETSEEHCCVAPYTACSVFLQAICICNRNDNKDRNGLCSCRK